MTLFKCYLLYGRRVKWAEGGQGGEMEVSRETRGHGRRFWGGGTVCGRPLAHTPAPLSTVLTLLMQGSPSAPALLLAQLCVPA